MTGRLHASPSFRSHDFGSSISVKGIGPVYEMGATMPSYRERPAYSGNHGCFFPARPACPRKKAFGDRTRIRTLLAVLLLAQFSEDGSALAQTDEATPTTTTAAAASVSSLTSNECFSTMPAGDTHSCYTAGAGAYAPPATTLSGLTAGWLYVGARSDPGPLNQGAIDVWGLCYYVNDVSSTTSYFVPFNTLKEWSAFTENYPQSGISLATCSRATTCSISPETPPGPLPACLTPTGAPVGPTTVNLPYAPTGTTYPLSPPLTFSCTGPTTGCVPGWNTSWTESAGKLYGGGGGPGDLSPGRLLWSFRLGRNTS